MMAYLEVQNHHNALVGAVHRLRERQRPLVPDAELEEAVKRHLRAVGAGGGTGARALQACGAPGAGPLPAPLPWGRQMGRSASPGRPCHTTFITNGAPCGVPV